MRIGSGHGAGNRRLHGICAALLVALLAGLSLPGAAQAPRAISFQAPISYDGPVPAPLQGASGNPLITADWDRDGRLDLAVITQEGLSVLYGNGDGTLGPPVDYPLGNGLHEGIAADLNRDGAPDLAVCHYGLGKLLVLLNSGRRTFAAPVHYPVAATPVGVTAADFNGDGALDLATSNHHAHNLTVLLNRGDGTFQPAVAYGGAPYPGRVIAADLDGNGTIDLAQGSLTENVVRVLLGDGTGRFTDGGKFPTAEDYTTQPMAEDYNGDGILDLAVACQGNFSLLLGDGTGRFGPPTRYDGFHVMDVADFDGDGDPDLVSPRDSASGFFLHQNHPAGQFLAPRAIPGVGGRTFAARVGDFNGDGRPDIVTWNESAPHLSVFLNSTPLPAPAVRSLVVEPAIVPGGCQSATGTVTLSEPAPAGGVSIALASTHPSTRVPAVVAVAPGAIRTSFLVTVAPVARGESGMISATFNGTAARARLTVLPIGVRVTVTPDRVFGGQSATVVITFSCPISARNLSITHDQLPATIGTVPTSVPVPEGATSVSYTITTFPRTTPARIRLNATGLGVDAVAVLEILPTPVVPPPTSGTTSPPVYNAANGHWYQAIQAATPVTWLEARAAAETLSYAGYRGHLVTLTSADEEWFLISNLPLSAQLRWWMGAYQDKTAPDYSEPGGGWRWVTGEPWSYTNWIPGEPNNDANVHDVGGDAGEFDTLFRNRWNDYPTRIHIPGYLVEYEPSTVPTVLQIQLFPPAVVGGAPATGQVTLAAPAGPGGVLLTLFSSNPAAAVVPATVVVPAGATTAAFPIVTFPVAFPNPVIITASGGGVAATTTLQVLPASLPLPPGPLLINGSFEDPGSAPYGTRSLPGWQVTQGTVDLVPPDGWQPAPGQGRQSLDLVGTPGAASIQQTFATVAGQSYTFSGWLSHNPGVSEGRANAFLNGGFFVQLYHSNALYGTATAAEMRWQPFAYTFRATAPSTTLTLTDVTGLWDGGGGAALDGLAVTPAGEPFAPSGGGPGGQPLPPLVPGAPANLTARLVSPAQIELSWLDASGDETGFEIQRRGGAGDWVWIALAAANTTRFSDYTVSPGTTYSYRVRATRDALASAWSNEASVTTVLLNGVTYVASYPQETLGATFTQPDGGVTVNAYRGYVLLRVTGVGQAYGSAYNDAFYLFTSPFSPPRNGHDGGFYQLTFGTSPLPARSLGSNAGNFLVGPLPAYNPAHDYTVLLDTRLWSPGPLHFGVSDGGYSDNTGAYVITVTQLVPIP
jgi:hypothetical protein